MANNTTNNADGTDTPHACGLSAQAIAWVQEHGSAFLRFCVAEGIKCIRIYNEERLWQEAPGWSLLDEIVYPPSNPPAVMMDLVLRARERFPQARLWQVGDDYDGEEYVDFVVVVGSPWPDGRRLVFDDRIRVYKD